MVCLSYFALFPAYRDIVHSAGHQILCNYNTTEPFCVNIKHEGKPFPVLHRGELSGVTMLGYGGRGWGDGGRSRCDRVGLIKASTPPRCTG